ncbi:hypothetical protein VSR01_16085 [Actinacidiphila sp. DG2A-62]|uniref:hypothetical protein n=1 Tax=Actinacidiphila sp. DG2A-62 TaxID=3108821 RepID=UPI002DBEED77|nr:hypothetical protein [Actinacidiphila sp. DG2A-62]MEC3994964.1 hypothetical protein [Actinacidiphila sp. DG2A-62]
MSESSSAEPPRVGLELPGGRTVPARLRRWRQDQAGKWWAELSLYAPAGAVRQLGGEDYAGVPREPAAEPEPEYLLVSLVRDHPRKELVVHERDCFTLGKDRWRYTIQTIDAGMARTMLARFDDTVPCQICKPDP